MTLSRRARIARRNVRVSAVGGVTAHGYLAFEGRHPSVARLQIVFVEPDTEAVAPKYFRKPPSRLRVCTGVTEKYVALANGWIRLRGHSA